MRVIAGSARGVRLECPPGEAVRPTPELARGAVFNVLGERIEGAAALDIFAGSGTFGIEALSRGAASAVFIELSARHIACLQRNLERTHLADRATVLRQDALRCIGRLKRRNERYDLVFLGPPFPMLKDPAGRAGVLDVMTGLSNESLLAEGGVIILQHDEPDPIPARIGPLARTDCRKYGRNVFAFFAAAEESDPELPTSAEG